MILHCGDIEDAEAVWLFPPTPISSSATATSSGPAIRQAIHGIGATLHEPFGRLELAGSIHRLAARRRPASDAQIEASGDYDYLFYGHTHVADQRRTGRTQVINPGALHRVRQKTFLVLDLESGEMETVVVD